MQFTREIRHLTTGMLIAFAIVAISTAYWVTFGPNGIVNRDDNPRTVETEFRLQRGMILDRDLNVLAKTTFGDDQIGQRQYLDLSFSSALGYSSYRYGVSGAEAAYNTILRGDDREPGIVEQWIGELLHQPQQGSDVQLTFDSNVQQTAAELLKGRRGAIVVLSVPSGQVLAMVSLPTFNPNTLDSDWETLIQSQNNPFFNRALQGSYQPGGILQTPLAIAALLANQITDTGIPNATQSIRLNNVEITCAANPPQVSLTLKEAYAYGCPYPFAQLISTMGIDTIQAVLQAFHLEERPVLAGYVSPREENTATTIVLNPLNLLETALGQGQMRATPLQMAMLTAALLNDGIAPEPYTLLAVRSANTGIWEQQIDPNTSQVPVTTAEVAAHIRDWMRETVSNGAAAPAQHSNLDIGGHVARAYSGKESQVWFIGFISQGSRQGATIAIVLEDTDDPAEAARIGGKVLEAAADVAP